MVSVKQASSSPLLSHRKLVDVLGRRVAWTAGHRIGLIESCREYSQWRQAMQACREGTPIMFKTCDNKPVINSCFDKDSNEYFPPANAKETANGFSCRGRSATKLIEKVDVVLSEPAGADSKAQKTKRKPRSYNRPPKKPFAASPSTKRTLEPRSPDFPPRRVVKAAARRTQPEWPSVPTAEAELPQRRRALGSPSDSQACAEFKPSHCSLAPAGCAESIASPRGTARSRAPRAVGGPDVYGQPGRHSPVFERGGGLSEPPAPAASLD